MLKALALSGGGYGKVMKQSFWGSEGAGRVRLVKGESGCLL